MKYQTLTLLLFLVHALKCWIAENSCYSAELLEISEKTAAELFSPKITYCSEGILDSRGKQYSQRSNVGHSYRFVNLRVYLYCFVMHGHLLSLPGVSWWYSLEPEASAQSSSLWIHKRCRLGFRYLITQVLHLNLESKYSNSTICCDQYEELKHCKPWRHWGRRDALSSRHPRLTSGTTPRAKLTQRLLAGNVTQPVTHKQAQTGGEVRQARKFVSLWRRKSTNLSASPAERR